VRAGLAEPVLGSQQIFRVVLDAMAHPGRIVSVPPPLETPVPLWPAAASLCLTLVDGETPVWLDAAARRADVIEYLRFHCGCPIAADPRDARFAVIADPSEVLSLDSFDAGSDEYPDRSATVIVQVEEFRTDGDLRLSGPGIEGETKLEVRHLPEAFWESVHRNHALFPRGVDLILAAGSTMVALPRSTRVDD
jgi:alpha-D-ribose 1-methylphosphonate 5-triphosphate synthase subunit PhnH